MRDEIGTGAAHRELSWMLLAAAFGIGVGLLAFATCGGPRPVKLTAEERRLIEEQEQLRQHDLPSIGETLGGEVPWPR